MAGDIDEKLAAVDDSLSAACGDDAPVDAADGRGREPVEERGEPSLDGEDAGAPSSEVAALTERVAELEAAVQALRGYAGSVRAVNDRVEERADAAVATTESLRERVAALEADGCDCSRGVASAGDRHDATVADGRRERGERRTSATARRDQRSRDRDAGECETCDGTGLRRDDDGNPRVGHADDTRPDGAAAESRSSGDGDPVEWPPAAPREPYGDVDADDDRERPGLVARLRDAL